MGKTLLVIVAVGAIAYFGWQQFAAAKLPPEIPFPDATGRIHSFQEYRGRGQPVLAAFWIQQCGYSDRTLTLLNSLRSKYPADRLAVVGFYLNPIEPGELAACGQQHGYRFTLVPLQTVGELGMKDLILSFGIDSAGDVGILDAQGRVRKFISSRNVSPQAFEERVRGAVAELVPGS